MILPKLRQVQADRERILRLLILMPKSVVYDLVNRVYVTHANEEDDDDQKEEEEDDGDEEEEEEDDDDNEQVAEAESQEITVIY